MLLGPTMVLVMELLGITLELMSGPGGDAGSGLLLGAGLAGGGLGLGLDTNWGRVPVLLPPATTWPTSRRRHEKFFFLNLHRARISAPRAAHRTHALTPADPGVFCTCKGFREARGYLPGGRVVTSW